MPKEAEAGNGALCAEKRPKRRGKAAEKPAPSRAPREDAKGVAQYAQFGKAMRRKGPRRLRRRI